ncbi:ABC transporter ATP-binding protein [Clostridium aciditolerans]|uniref:ATP-binding cassette domain-containing protein n=1 Tax=Clostridium aciditolerans TaxID=339861 RepID=A0A934M1P5_9CLOT|nr:ATP-binding cassette domain-containing protein [Clostridium aciditolerans]MBI6871302.1 ATP-binding cassette domain-containing protein [Clostridium aciditolerans]
MLQIKNLQKVFNKDTVNEQVVFKDLSLNINKGDFVTIIGSNGAGKSTILNLISGSLPIDNGSIILEGKEISALPEYKRTKFIGRVFQNPTLGTSPSMTILENLSMAYNKGKAFNLTACVNKKNIGFFKEMLSELSLDLENVIDTKVGLLSGGQRQALSLLMSTMSNPELLLLDEHTAALDPRTSENIIEMTKKTVTGKNITTLMVTHNLSHAINTGNRLIMLHRGEAIVDVSDKEKANLTIPKLLDLFKNKNCEDFISDTLALS